MLAGDVRSGLSSPWAVLPSGRSTAFIEELTGLVYTIFGSSRLGGFMVFTWFSFWGLVFFIKAAAVAIPGLSTRRYALALFLFPSLVYWGSSIGKEAFVGMCLGLAAYGAALVLSRQHDNRAGVTYTAIGLVLTAMVRPHFAAIWAGAIVIALFARLTTDIVGARADGKRGLQLSTVALAAVAAIGFVVIASITLSYLDPAKDETADVAVQDRLSSIFDKVEEHDRAGRLVVHADLRQQPTTVAVRRVPHDHPPADHRGQRPRRAVAGDRDDRDGVGGPVGLATPRQHGQAAAQHALSLVRAAVRRHVRRRVRDVRQPRPARAPAIFGAATGAAVPVCAAAA